MGGAVVLVACAGAGARAAGAAAAAGVSVFTEADFLVVFAAALILVVSEVFVEDMERGCFPGESRTRSFNFGVGTPKVAWGSLGPRPTLRVEMSVPKVRMNHMCVSIRGKKYPGMRCPFGANPGTEWWG